MMIGTGGTITSLAQIGARASRPCDLELVDGRDTRSTVVDHATLGLKNVRALVDQLRSLSFAERKKVPGLAPERADIIVAGGAVFLVAMETLGASQLTVSIRNLRYGALVTS